MKKNLYQTLILACATWGLAACSSEELTPKLEFEPEYAHLTRLTAQSSHADSVIAQWYSTYNCAILYDFKEEDFSWLWAGKFNKPYVKLDVAQEGDSIILEQLIDLLESKVKNNYEEDFLKENLPYKIFLVKELRDGYLGRNYMNVLSNGQDAFFVGHLKSETRSFTAANFEENFNTEFAQLFFGKMTVRPTAFFEAIVPVRFNLITTPVDKAIEAEGKQYPDFVNPKDMNQKNLHAANVLGYVRGGTPAVRVPSQGRDYADFLAFITNNPGSYIRQRTQYYKRLAKRATLFLDFFKTVKGEDLIEKQNLKFPDDKVTFADFSYPQD